MVGVQRFDRAPAARAALTGSTPRGLGSRADDDSGRMGASLATLFVTSAPGARIWAPNCATKPISRTPPFGAWYASHSDSMLNQLRPDTAPATEQAPTGSKACMAACCGVRIAKDGGSAESPEGERRDRGGFAGVDGAFPLGEQRACRALLESAK